MFGIALIVFGILLLGGTDMRTHAPMPGTESLAPDLFSPGWQALAQLRAAGLY